MILQYNVKNMCIFVNFSGFSHILYSVTLTLQGRMTYLPQLFHLLRKVYPNPNNK